jgi:small GTP-binding protein
MKYAKLEYSYLFKFIIVGDPRVGKSSLFSKFILNTSRYDYYPTIGVDFGTKIIKTDDTNVNIQIWDTAGSSNFRSIIRSYYFGAIGVILCYDVNNRESFNNLKDWIQEINVYTHDHVNIYLVGLQKNLRASTINSVTFEEGKKFAKENNCLFVEINNINEYDVNKMFQVFSNDILEKINKFELVPSRHVGVIKYSTSIENTTIKCEPCRTFCTIL